MSNKIMLYTTEPKSFVQEQLEEQAKKQGFELVIVNPLEGFSILSNDDSQSIYNKEDKISKEDFVYCIPRLSETDLNYKVSALKVLEKLEIPLLNGADSLKNASNKMEMQLLLNAAGVKTPKSIFLNDKDPLDKAVKALGDVFPMVVKTVYGTHGVGVIKADSLSSLRSIIQQLIKTQNEFMVQEFIEHDKAYRILSLGDEVIGCVERTTADGDFRTNAHQGSEVTKHEPNTAEKEECLKAAKAIGTQLSAVDYIISKDGEVIILEVNGSPGFESMQEVVEENIAEKIIGFCTKGLSKDSTETPKEPEKTEEPTPEPEKSGENKPEVIKPEELKKDETSVIGTVDSITIKFFNDDKPIEARIDTGAEYSCIHGKDIEVGENNVTFTFGELRYRFKLAKNVKIISSNGDESRPVIKVDVVLGGITIPNAEFTVSDREGLKFDALIGRRLLGQANIMIDPTPAKADEEE